MALEWNPRLSVGNDLIDRQHQELFRRFDQLLEACQQRRGKEEVVSVLRFLDDYVHTHFGEEERLMTRHQYPALAEHRAAHRDFIGQLKELTQLLDAQGPTSELVITTNQTVLAWLIQHIKTIDVRLGTFLRDKASE